MKKIIRIAVLCASLALICTFFATGIIGKSSADPADSYVKQTAPYEDSSIDLWFEHSFRKVLTEDTTPSGMDTYSVYMAKNEIENAQFVLCSDETKAGMTASVTNFTNDNGDEIPAEIQYQFYVTVDGLIDNNIFGAASEADNFIREGEIPDPVVPLKYVNKGVFQLNAGKSQAFYIKIRSDETTPAGWYSAQLDIKNADGQIVKTATVYTYVWDFALAEETALQSAFILSLNTSYGGSYEAFYDYLLDNRLMACDIPGRLVPTNPYITNPRVSAIRVSAYTEQYAPGVRYSDSAELAPLYTDIYNRLSAMNEWEDIKDKFYFYNVDEPLPQDLLDAAGSTRHSVDHAKHSKEVIEKYWGGHANTVIPHGEEHYYPYSYYQGPIANYPVSQLHSATQEMIDEELCTVWCPRLYGFTPASETDKFNYVGREDSIIRVMSGPYSGNPFAGEEYYDWESIYGDFTDRVLSQMAIANADGNENIKLWAYSAGMNKGYSYTNHLIENTGLQTKMMFWQLYQEDCTGYLYYGSNNWTENDNLNGEYADATQTGSKTNCAWKVNKYPLPHGSHVGSYIYGNGVLFYGATQGKVQTPTGCIGSIRVEMMRDGVEEYQMLTMLEEYMGEKAAKDIVSSVSTNIVNYLSMPGFVAKGYSADMDDYDVMALVRRHLGDTLEAAVLAGQCDHSFDDGVVVEEAGCLTIGYRAHTCTKCGAVEERVIPTLHTVGDCFETVWENAATCTADGEKYIRCTLCGYEKQSKIDAFHNDSDYYVYSGKSDSIHSISCSVCKTEISTGIHNFFTVNTATCTEGGESLSVCKTCGHTIKLSDTEARGHCLKDKYIAPTCTEEGLDGMACINCDHTEGTAIPASGHTYGDDNICTVCGYELTYILGDLDGDFEVSAKDLNIVKRYLGGLTNLTEIQALAGDVNGDGDVSAVDMNRIVRYLAGTIAGL